MAQTARDFIEEERNTKLAEAKAITDKAESEKRSLAPEEVTQIEGLIAEAEELKARVAKFDEEEKLRKDLNGMIGPVAAPATKGAAARTVGEAFTQSDAYKALLENGGFKANSWTTGPVEVGAGFKEALSGSELTEVNSAVIPDDFRTGIVGNLLRRLTVADLIPQGTTNSNTVTVIQEEGFAESAGSRLSAAPTAETAAKPEGRVRLEEVPESVRKIAAFLAVSDEMLEDLPALQSFIDTRLRADVLQTEEDQLLNGDGTPPALSGVLDRSIQTATQAALGGDPLDAVYKAITAIRNVFVEPSGIVVNPTDWEIFRLAKDLNDQYYGGGPFTGAYGNSGGVAANNLWGFPVVVTPAIAAGTLLVGAFNSAAMIFRRGGVTVEASNSHNDFFQRNMTAIRAEERLALAVDRPQGFFAITGVAAESA